MAHFLTLAAILLATAVGIIAGVLAYRESISLRRGKLLLLASLSLGVAISLLGLYPLLVRWRMPQRNAEGIIQSASGRNRTHTIQIGIEPAGTLVLYAEGHNSYFRQGERVRVRYQEHTGLIMRADFLSERGSIEGAYRDAGWIGPGVWLILGLLILFGSIRMHKRDPEGAEEDPGNTKPYGPVDKWSLLQELNERGNHTNDH